MKRVMASFLALLGVPGFLFAQAEPGGDTAGNPSAFVEMSVNGGVPVQYSDQAAWQAAIDAAKSGDLEITLLADFTVTGKPITFTASTLTDIWFDLNGHTLSAALEEGNDSRHLYAVESKGDFVLRDTSEAQTGAIRARGIRNLASGEMVIEGGTIVDIDAYPGAVDGAAIYNEAKLTISGGTFKTEYVGTDGDSGGPACLRNVGAKAKATITGGTFASQSVRTYAIVSSGELTVSPAEGTPVTVTGPRALAIDSGTAVIDGGTFTATGWYGLYVSNDGTGDDPLEAVVTVNGGTFQGKTYAVWVGSDHNDPVNSTIVINDGVFVNALNRQEVAREDAIVVKGGTYAADPATYGITVAPGYRVASAADGTYAVVEGPAFAIGETLYETLGEAFAALVGDKQGAAITLLRDATSTAQAMVPSGAAGTFDLNGFTYTYTGAAYTSAINAWLGNSSDPAITLTITDSSAQQTGAIVAKGKADGCVASSNAHLTVTGGRFVQEGTAGYAITATDGLVIAPAEGRTVELPSGGLNLRQGSWTTIKEVGVTIKGGTFVAGNAPAYALYTGNGRGPSTLTITGGTFEGGTDNHVAYFATATNVVISGGDFTDGDLHINAPTSTVVTVSGGSFRDDPRTYGATLPDGFSVVGDGGSFTAQSDEGATYVAQIGTVKYTDAIAAFSAVKDGETLMLLGDYAGRSSPTVKAFGVTIDLNGHTLWGQFEASTQSNAGSGLKFAPTSSMTPSKPEYDYYRVIDSSAAKSGTIKGQVPVQASTGNSRNRLALEIAEGITLEPTTDAFGGICVLPKSGVRVPAEVRYVAWLGTANPLFKATDAEGQSWLFPSLGAAEPFANDGVVTLCANYSGSSPIVLSEKTLTLDLGGFTYERVAGTSGTAAEIVSCTSSDTHLTIRNGTLKGNCDGVVYAPPAGKTIQNVSLTMEDVTLASTFAAAGSGYGLVANGTMSDVDFTLRRCKLLLGPFAAEVDGPQAETLPDTEADICAIYFPPRGDSTLTLEDTLIKSPRGVQVCSGNLVVLGDTQITVTAANLAAQKSGDGAIPDGAAISVVAREGYGEIGSVTISGTPTLIAQGAGATALVTYAWNATDKTQEDWAEDAEHVTVTGGTYSHAPAQDLLAPGLSSAATADGTFVVDAYVAEVNGAKFLSLAEAITAAKEGATIVLLADIADQADVYVREGQTLTLDLNGHTLGLAKDCSLNLLYGGSLNLIGSGAVKHTGKYGAIYIYGAQKNAPEQIRVAIGSNVTVESEGNNAIAIADTNGLCYGLVLNVEGTLKGQCGVNISGNIQETEANVPVITLAESSKIVAEGVGIYAAGYAHWTLAGDVTGADALSIKSGTFSITGGDYFATGAFADPAEANGNGSENTGAAVSITTNDGYAKAPIEIAITGGTFTSTNGYAFYEGIAKKGDVPAAEASRAVIEISGGTFKGNATNEAVAFDVAITTAADKRVISGGVFSMPVPEELCAYGYAPVATPNAEGMYTVEHPRFTKVGVLLEDGTYTVYDSMYAALYDTNGMAQEDVKATVIVLEDTSLDSYFRVMAGQEVTLDLNGHVLTCTGGPGITYAIDWLGGDNATVAKPTITITDSSVGQTGVMRSEGAFLDGLVRMVGGTLNITGGRFVQAVADPNAQYKDNIFVLKEGLRVAPEEGRTVEVSGGTVRIETGVDASTQALGTLIQGGTFHSVEGRPAIEVPYSTQGLVISGGSFEGEGEALRIGAPTTVTVTGGDFTADTILVADANATLVLNGGDFAGASIAAEGGTLAVGREVTDLSAATIGGFATLSLAGDLALGANRMTATAVVAEAEATVSVAATRDELDAGKVAVFASDAQGAVPANLSLALANLSEGQALAEAETVAADGVVALTFTAVPEAVAAESALLQAILPYLRSQGLHNVVSLSGATAGESRPLSVAEMADVVAVFSGAEGLLSATAAEGGTALALAYDFGITGVRATDAGLVVTAQVRGAEGRSLAFAEEADFALVDVESGEPLDAVVARGASGDVVTFTVPLASVPDSDSLRLRVRVRAGVGND